MGWEYRWYYIAQTEGTHSAKQVRTIQELVVFCVMFYFKQKSLMPNVLKLSSLCMDTSISTLHIRVCVSCSLSLSLSLFHIYNYP